MSDDLPSPPNRQFLFYDTEDGVTRVQMLVDGNTVWMPQKAIAELFETSVANVNIHIGNICDDSEVDPDSVIKEYLITAGDGKLVQSSLRFNATKWRHVVAMGVSPWNTENTRRSPEGTTGTQRHLRPFAPSGLSVRSRSLNHGLAPMATAFRPIGTYRSERHDVGNQTAPAVHKRGTAS